MSRSPLNSSRSVPSSPYSKRSSLSTSLLALSHYLISLRPIQTRRALTPRDFEFLKLIGVGTFGKVFQVRKKDTRRIYAMKVLSKKEIVAKKEVAHTIGERKILQRSLDSPFLVGLKFSFQSDTDLYLVTDFKSGGELFWHLQRETRFSEERARFYIAELTLALEHLHKYNIVYRCVATPGPPLVTRALTPTPAISNRKISF